MRRSLRVALSVSAGFVLLVASSSQAQQTHPHRWAMQVATDVGTILNFYGESCHTAAPAAGGGISILRRLPHRVVAMVDMRANGVLDVGGCKLTVPPPRPIGPNEYENLPINTYPNGAPKKPFMRTALRVGIETPPNRAMGRITVGGGLFWTGARTPFATLGLDAGTRGDGARMTVGLETSRAWVRTHSTYSRFRLASGSTTPLPSRSESRLDVRGWTQLHFGLELPLR